MNTSDQTKSDAPPPKESDKHTFRRAAGILGGIIVLSIAALAGYALWILPSQRGDAAPVPQNALVAQALTSIAGVLRVPTVTVTPPPSQTPVTAPAGPSTAQAAVFPTVAITPLLTETPVAEQSTASPMPASSTSDLAAATAEVASTDAALAQLTLIPDSTALPGTGIGDQYSPAGLVIAALALIGVIFLARRLRIGAGRQ